VGQVNIEIMRDFMHLRGDVAEMGVNHGSSSKIMIPVAEEHDKTIWLYDSFKGMPYSTEPTDLEQYPKGRFNGASADKIIKAHDYKHLRVVAGWLPESMMNVAVRYCFVYLDLDHYEGTLATLRRLWHRIIIGGGILCDDYFPERSDRLATRAIDEFISDTDDLETVVYKGQILLISR
jgi:hypothetical protein